MQRPNILQKTSITNLALLQIYQLNQYKQDKKSHLDVL